MVPTPTLAHLACHQSLTSSALELKYARSAHSVDIITKDEDVRRIRFDLHILQDDNDELRALLAQEVDRSDAFEGFVKENLARAEDAEAQLQVLEEDTRAREQELLTMRAEMGALKNNTEDVTAALTEKLALTRELSQLRPELEHMKAQAANAEVFMAEKLALQRQISNVQCELENAKREAQRALAKRRNTGVEIAQEVQMDDLRRQLVKEKRARERAEQAADVSQADLGVDEVRKELAHEKRARQRAEEALEEAQQNTQIEDVRGDLLQEKKAKQKIEDAFENLQKELKRERKAAARAAKVADGNAAVNEQAEELSQELAKEKKALVVAERAAKQAAEEFEAQRALLDDKLTRSRDKLRSMREKLSEMEAELAAAHATASTTTEPPGKAPAATKNTKKRTAARIDADANALGTPGDGPAAKRKRKAAPAVGDKSTFSITPFLKRTTSAAPESADEKSGDDGEASPAPTKKTKQPLAVQPVSNTNVPPKKAPAQRTAKATPALAVVTEEEPAEDVHAQGQENAGKPVVTMKIKTKVVDGPDETNPVKKKPKIRKSIHEFASFAAGADEPVKKKRKLGGLGRTLFDEEEEMAPRALPGRAMYGMKGFGAFGAGKMGGVGNSTGTGGPPPSFSFLFLENRYVCRFIQSSADSLM
ncbi:hypothetical protein LTR12_005513 [Friedmanniomyces endolithicus]|nr:hypothetical protein LTR74_005947 [Friedmanniomyces endolithicus]KAK1820072.1 hypothetical protein LTR12_005513 [Friedmanniomyces endolithicus]